MTSTTSNITHQNSTKIFVEKENPSGDEKKFDICEKQKTMNTKSSSITLNMINAELAEGPTTDLVDLLINSIKQIKEKKQTPALAIATILKKSSVIHKKVHMKNLKKFKQHLDDDWSDDEMMEALSHISKTYKKYFPEVDESSSEEEEEIEIDDDEPVEKQIIGDISTEIFKRSMTCFDCKKEIPGGICRTINEIDYCLKCAPAYEQSTTQYLTENSVERSESEETIEIPTKTADQLRIEELEKLLAEATKKKEPKIKKPVVNHIENLEKWMTDKGLDMKELEEGVALYNKVKKVEAGKKAVATRIKNGTNSKRGGGTKTKSVVNTSKGPNRVEGTRFKMLGSYISNYRPTWKSYSFATNDGKYCEYCPSYAIDSGNEEFKAYIGKLTLSSQNVLFEDGPKMNGRTDINWRGLRNGIDYVITEEKMTDAETTKLWGICQGLKENRGMVAQ